VQRGLTAQASCKCTAAPVGPRTWWVARVDTALKPETRATTLPICSPTTPSMVNARFKPPEDWNSVFIWCRRRSCSAAVVCKECAVQQVPVDKALRVQGPTNCCVYESAMVDMQRHLCSMALGCNRAGRGPAQYDDLLHYAPLEQTASSAPPPAL
jgi:hypothetical protein